jgi:hypothetical protein
MDEDPSNEAFVLSLLEGYDIDKAEAMETEVAPTRKTIRANTLLGSIEGSYPRIGPRQDASAGRPNRSPWSTTSCISAPHLES